MSLTLDHQCLASPLPDLATALNLVREQTQRAGRLVTEVTLDGRPFDPFAPGAAAELTASSNLSFVSQPVPGVIAAAYRDAIELLADLAGLQSRTADRLLTGLDREAAAMLDTLLAHWNRIQQCVSSGCALVEPDVAALHAEVPALTPAVNDLLNRLGDLRTAVTASDWATVSDLLAYDFGPLTEQWRALLHTLHRRLPAAA